MACRARRASRAAKRRSQAQLKPFGDPSLDTIYGSLIISQTCSLSRRATPAPGISCVNCGSFAGQLQI